MANTFGKSRLRAELNTVATGPTGASHYSRQDTQTDFGYATFTGNILELGDYSLTVAAGNLDLDLYDLGTLDLGAGAGRDNLGNAWTQTAVHSVFIENTSASATGVLRIDQSGATTTAWTGLFGGNTVTDLPAGAFIAANLGTTGATVTDVTSHILRLSAQTADCTINVHIVTS